MEFSSHVVSVESMPCSGNGQHSRSETCYIYKTIRLDRYFCKFYLIEQSVPFPVTLVSFATVLSHIIFQISSTVVCRGMRRGWSSTWSVQRYYR